MWVNILYIYIFSFLLILGFGRKFVFLERNKIGKGREGGNGKLKRVSYKVIVCLVKKIDICFI